MAEKILANALREFDLALDDIASNLEFVRAAMQLRPRLKDMLAWPNMDGEAKKLAIRFLDQGAAEESVFYRGMVISLSGAFEQLVRRILRDGVRAINEAEGNFDSLHETLKRQNVYRTGLALQTIFEPLDYLELDYELLSKNLGTCFVGSRQAVLNADAFTIFLSIISPEKLADAMNRIGIKINWDKLGSIQAMRDAFETDKTRETAKAIQEFLTQFGRTRNKIAHTGSSGVIVGDSDLEQLLKLFRVFARGLCGLIEAEVGTLIPK